jgi:hypothetical protein
VTIGGIVRNIPEHQYPLLRVNQSINQSIRSPGMAMARQFLALTAVAGTAILFLASNCYDSLHSFPRRLEIKTQSKSKPKSRILDDGTLFLARGAESPCAFFRRGLRNNITRIHYHFEDCVERQLGNRIGEHFGRYLLASAAHVPYTMTCGNNDNVYQVTNVRVSYHPFESVTKHLEVHNAQANVGNWTVFDVCRICNGLGWSCHDGIQAMSDVMREAMWILAHNTTTGQSFEPDDAVIHLRLGDALRGKWDEGIGLLPHEGYSILLKEAESLRGPIQSISIVTASFDKKYARSFDAKAILRERSAMVAYDFVRHLNELFPNATVTIHNGPDESSLKSYARLIRAKKVSICGSSTFCTLPVLANREGIGFVYRTERHNPWAVKAAEKYDNIKTWKVPRLTNNVIEQMDDSAILHWLRNQDAQAGEFIIGGAPLIRPRVMTNKVIQ